MDLNGWTMQQVADALNITKGTVSKALSLLKLPEDIQAQVEEGQIAPTVAYEISRVEGEGAQRELARRVVDEGLKRDDAGQLAGKARRGRGGRAKPSTTKVFEVDGARVTVTWARESVGPEDIIAALGEAIAQAEGDGGLVQRCSSGSKLCRRAIGKQDLPPISMNRKLTLS